MNPRFILTLLGALAFSTPSFAESPAKENPPQAQELPSKVDPEIKELVELIRKEDPPFVPSLFDLSRLSPEEIKQTNIMAIIGGYHLLYDPKTYAELLYKERQSKHPYEPNSYSFIFRDGDFDYSINYTDFGFQSKTYGNIGNGKIDFSDLLSLNVFYQPKNPDGSYPIPPPWSKNFLDIGLDGLNGTKGDDFVYKWKNFQSLSNQDKDFIKKFEEDEENDDCVYSIRHINVVGFQCLSHQIQNPAFFSYINNNFKTHVKKATTYLKNKSLKEKEK